MCKLGDIVVINNFKNENNEDILKHSFVIINDEADYLNGLRYDFVANMMCSFHNERHKKKKLKHKSNLPIKEKMISGKRLNSKEGYIKADQLYYFDKKKIKYHVIAHIDENLLDELVKLILLLHEEGNLKMITTNIQKKNISDACLSLL